MKNPQYCYITDLSCDTVSKILSRNNGDMVIQLHGKQVEIRCISKNYGNSWNSIFYGAFDEHLNGTMISGEFKLEASVRIGMRMWRWFAIFMAVFAFIGTVANGTDILGILLFTFVPLLMFLFSFFAEAIGRSMGEEGEREILRFIEKELAAKPHKIDSSLRSE